MTVRKPEAEQRRNRGEGAMRGWASRRQRVTAEKSVLAAVMTWFDAETRAREVCEAQADDYVANRRQSPALNRIVERALEDSEAALESLFQQINARQQ